MSTLLTFLALAAAICVAHGQSPSNSVPLVATTATVPLVATTATVPLVATTVPLVATTATIKPTVTPTPTTQPPTTEPPTTQPPATPSENNYFLNNTDKTVCLHVMARISLSFNYTTNHGTRYHPVNFEKGTVTVHPDSMCSASAQKAMLYLQFTPHGEEKPYFLNLTFEGYDKTWNITETEVKFTYNAADFPDYIGHTPPTGLISKMSFDGWFESDDVKLNQSFACGSNRSIGGFDPITSSMDVVVYASELRAQAFDFSGKDGLFDEGPICSEDHVNTGNKVVPIAVGAALAGLVIVVLIAYLIGRLRNRKKSSYEALS